MEIPLKGKIRDTSLVKLLVALSRERKTGTLSLVNTSFTKKIYMNTGHVIFASSTYEDDRLGEMLLKADKITVEHYDKAVEVLKASKKRLGAILVDLGFITPKDLFWGVKYQVKEIIYSMFLIEDAEYQFHEGGIPTQEVITLKMSMGNLIYEGVRKIDNWTRIRNEMPAMESVLKLSIDPLHLFQDIELNPQDKKILSLIDGRKTIKEVIESSGLGSFEALRILYVIWSIGIIQEEKELGAAEKGPGAAAETVSLDDIFQPISEEEEALLIKVDSLYTRLDKMNMAELLDIDERTDKDTIKKKYYKLAKEYHPDRYFGSADDSMKTKLAAIFDAITKAYTTMSDDKLRKEYFKPKPAKASPKAAVPTDKERAEEQFKIGVGEFKKGNFWGAVENFKWATKLMPGIANYWNYLSLSYTKIPGRIKDAEEALVEAIKADPKNADYHANLGLIYTKAGLKKRAQFSFEKALKIEPSNEKAKKGLEQAKGK